MYVSIPMFFPDGSLATFELTKLPATAKGAKPLVHKSKRNSKAGV